MVRITIPRIPDGVRKLITIHCLRCSEETLESEVMRISYTRRAFTELQSVIAMTAVLLLLLQSTAVSQDFRGFGSRGGGDSGGRPSFGGGRPDFGSGRGSFGGRPDFGGGRPSFGGFGGGRPDFGGGRPDFGGGRPDLGGGRPESSSSDRTSRFIEMMDRNRNGVMDQDEIDRMPSFVRDMIKSRGIELKSGMSFNQLRSQSGGENGGQKPNDSKSRQALRPYKMKPKPPITLALPPKWAELDTDLDGQVAMYEWLLSRRSDLDQFDQFDTDFDGLLTPAELLAAENATASPSDSYPARERLKIVSATPASRGRSGSSDSSRGGDPRSSGDRGSRSPEDTAKYYFSILDRDKDGRLSSEEWQRSRRVRGMFEQAGIRLENMSASEFTRNYVSQSSSDGRR